MALEFTDATRESAKLRLALIGPPGSGKTMTALKIAHGLVPGGPIFFVDTEHDSGKKYAPPRGQAADPSRGTFAFKHVSLETFSPENYIEAISVANARRAGVLILDSITHAWAGKGGALEMVDQAAKRSQSGNKFMAWGDITPLQNRFIDAMLGCKPHLIVTIRSKVEHVVEVNAQGKSVPRKVGMAPIQRDGVEYEFDVTMDMTTDNDGVVSKTRCSALAGQVFRKPGEDVAAILRAWLDGIADPDSVIAEIGRTESGKELLKWSDAVNSLRDEGRQAATLAFVEKWQRVVSNAKNAATLDAILAAIAGMPRPLCVEVATACESVAAKRRAELGAEGAQTPQN